MKENRKALIITGSAGSSKSAKAREIASRKGKYQEIKASDMDWRFWASQLVDNETVIVDECPSDNAFLSQMKSYVTSEYIQIENQGHNPIVGKRQTLFLFSKAPSHSNWTPAIGVLLYST